MTWLFLIVVIVAFSVDRLDRLDCRYMCYDETLEAAAETVTGGNRELDARLVRAYRGSDELLTRALSARVAAASPSAPPETAHADTLAGAMAADDTRLRAAEARVWPDMTWGCDAPEHMADAILALRAENARLREFVRDSYTNHANRRDL